MAGRGWLSDALQRIGWKGAVPPEAEAELEAPDCAALKKAICRLGSSDVFTQEELATFRRLEADKRALFGGDLACAVAEAGLDEDPRLAADYAHEAASQQRKDLDRLQRRCQVLKSQQYQFATLARQAQSESEALREAADEREAALNRHYNTAAQALNANESQCLGTAATLSAGALRSPHLLFSYCDSSDLEKSLAVLTELARGLQEGLEVPPPPGWGAACAEARRVEDAHLVSLFSVACARSEKAASDAELDYLRSVAGGGNPDVEVEPERLRSAIRAAQTGVEAGRAEVKAKARELLSALRDAGAAVPVGTGGHTHQGSDFSDRAFEIQRDSLKEDIEALDDALYFQRQAYALSVMARGWLDREAGVAAVLKDNSSLGATSLRNHADLGTRVVLAAQAMASQTISSEKQRLLAVHNPAHPAAGGLGGAPVTNLGEAVSSTAYDVANLEGAVSQGRAEGASASTAVMEGYRQLLLCLESHREGGAGSGGGVSVPQTYFEGDLAELRDAVDAASDRMLDAMDAIAEAKGRADTSWTHDVAKGAVSFQSAIETPPRALADPHTAAAQPRRGERRDDTMNTSAMSAASGVSAASRASHGSTSVQRLMETMGTPQQQDRPGERRIRFDDRVVEERQRRGERGADKADSPYQARPKGVVERPAAAAVSGGGTPARSPPSPGRVTPQKRGMSPRVASPGATPPKGKRPTAQTVPQDLPVVSGGGGGGAPAAAAAAPTHRVPSFLLRPDGTKMTPQEYKQRNRDLLKSIHANRRG